MDDSLDSSEGAESGEGDIPVDIKTLETDGIRPSVGDRVDFQVQGVVRQIVDETVFVTPETANGQPLATAQPASDEDSMRAAAMNADMAAY